MFGFADCFSFLSLAFISPCFPFFLFVLNHLFFYIFFCIFSFHLVVAFGFNFRVVPHWVLLPYFSYCSSDAMSIRVCCFIRPRRSFSMNCVTYFGTSLTLPVVSLFLSSYNLYCSLLLLIIFLLYMTLYFALCFTIFFIVGCASAHYSSVRTTDGHVVTVFSMANMYARVALN